MKRSIALLAVSVVSTAITAPASGHEAGTWVLRAGAGVVQPKSKNFDLGSIDLGGGASIDSATIEVDKSTSLVLSGTYMFTENWAIDILAAWPFKHDVDLAGTITVGGATESGSIRIADVKHLPPTVSVQYHFLPDAQFQPYAGIGANYTMFSSESVTGDAADIGLIGLDLDNSFGLAAQVGADWVLNDRWLVNLDVRWADIDADANVTVDDGTGPETGELGTIEIDPWVYSISVGYRF